MIVIDLEFSGMDPEVHSILSLGAVDFENPNNTLYLECFPRKGSEWDEQAAEVHGLSKEYLKKVPLSEKQLVEQFIAWGEKIAHRTLAGQGMSWDILFLYKACLRYGLNWPFKFKIIESHSIATMHHILHQKKIPLSDGISKLGLDAICQYVGLDKRLGSHNALDDAQRTAECLSRLLYNKKLLKEFSHFPIPKW